MMTKIIIRSCVVVGLVGSLSAHGPGHAGRHGAGEVEENAVVADGGKNFNEMVVEESRGWGAMLATGWESRHVHYGVNETGDGGAYTTELGVWFGDWSLGVWNGFGTSTEFQKWDFTLAYNLELGPVFIVPGYNYRYFPSAAEDSHGGGHDEHHDEHHSEEEEHEEESLHASHSHSAHGHEVFVLAGLDVVPYVTPSALFVWDLSNTPGAFLEFRLDGEVPVVGEYVVLRPYASLGVNLGYNTTSYYGWNNFQYGLELEWRLNETISVTGGVNQSVAMRALQDIDQGNAVWAGGGLVFRW
jgi:hypothetical protein